MTPLRQRMLEDMQLRGFSARTQECYVAAVRQLAEHYHVSPVTLTDEQLRQYFLYLTNEKKVARTTATIALCAIRFRHAGENLARVLAERAADLGPPIHMCDALSRNFPKSLAVVLAHCLAHARRRFVDVTPSFPADVGTSSRRSARCTGVTTRPARPASRPGTASRAIRPTAAR